jgi:hypothetical protein
MPVEVKTIGASGQISIGKQYAGRTVTVEEVDDGVWVIKTARVIPENEMWLHQPAEREKLDRAIAWAEKNPAHASDMGRLGRTLTRRK